ncbi:MAG: site-specific integrase, partial [Bacteroidota bacterium]
YRQKKTSRVEYLPLSAQAQKYLGKPGEPGKCVFDLPTHAPVYHALTKWAQVAGVTKPISFHVSRHTFATLALTFGADLYTVSKLLGHASVKTTEIYGQIVDEKKRAAVELIPEL